MLRLFMALLLAGTMVWAEDYKDAPFQGWAQNEERGSTRLIYFSKTTDKPWDYSPGQVAIEYGKPVWKEEYNEKFDELTRGKRWRMGQNYWSNFDARFPVHLGTARIEKGIYYLALERSQDDQWSLVFFNPEDLSSRKMDAWHINRKEGPVGVKAPLEWTRVEEVAEHLQIQFVLDEKDQRKAQLEIRFGPHKLTTDVRAEFEGKQVESDSGS